MVIPPLGVRCDLTKRSRLFHGISGASLRRIRAGSFALIRRDRVTFQTIDDKGYELRGVRQWLLVILFSSVFLQRFAVPVGATGVSVNLIITLSVIGFLLLRGQLSVDPVRATVLLMFIAYALLGTAFNGDRASWSSTLLVIAMYVPFAFMLRSLDTFFQDCLRAFQTMTLVCAILGIAQFFLQFVISSKLLFTFQDFLPSWTLLDGFANLLPISYLSPLNRSNGFVMVEPSVFSQYIAVAVIIEMLYFQVKWRLAVYGAALLFSYSGTGLVIFVLLPAIMLQRRSYATIAVVTLFVVIAMLTSDLWHADVTAQRVTEIGSNSSSAYARYFAPADLIGRYLIFNPQGLVFGLGPGAIREYIIQMPYETHDPAWAKVLVEYGLIGSALFWTMFILAVFANSPSIWLSTALAIGFLSFGGEFLDPRFQSLMLVFCVLPKRAAFAALRPTRSLGIVENAT